MDRSARSRTSRVLAALAITGVLPLLAGCPEKKAPVVIDAGPVATAPPSDTTTQLVPLDDTTDAGADADAAPPKHLGPAVNPNVARLKQCCNALAAQAKQNANSPEGQMMLTAATQCSTAAASVGPSGTAPELAVIRQMLAGHTIPPVCQGL